MVDVGAALTTEPVEEDNAVIGLQLKLLADPVTLKVAESPRQTNALLTVI